MPNSATVTPVRIDVQVPSGVYPVHIEAGLSARIHELLDDIGFPRRRFIVSSPTVWRLHGEQFRTASEDEPILVADGERYKTASTLGRIYDALVKAQADRGAGIIAIGGGVIGDVAGFAAATFMRGIPVAQVPTTLLAQVDAAVGGKVGVNHPLGKNLIGAFHQPSAVLIDPAVLASLPRREFRSGLYEVVKYGMIASRSLFDRVNANLPALFARDIASLVPAISESCRIKATVVGDDERESGPRRVLNFGHTAGHALEAVTKYRRFRHGEAVAYGMIVAAEVAVARGMLAPEHREALGALITKMGPLPAVADIDTAAVLEATARDKKVVAGRLHFVLPTSIGSTAIVDDVSVAELERALVGIGLRGNAI